MQEREDLLKWPGWEVRAVEAAVVRAMQHRRIAEKEIEVEIEDPLHHGHST
jgi:hypothetical protein